MYAEWICVACRKCVILFSFKHTVLECNTLLALHICQSILQVLFQCTSCILGSNRTVSLMVHNTKVLCCEHVHSTNCLYDFFYGTMYVSGYLWWWFLIRIVLHDLQGFSMHVVCIVNLSVSKLHNYIYQRMALHWGDIACVVRVRDQRQRVRWFTFPHAPKNTLVISQPSSSA